ncbi:MAG: YcaO-like family protein, partial [Spirochaetales bacterium]|nr:YcaO-like family protein [Spirochaetales bacterium]
YSNRITLYPTAAGVNGKGTDELYSTASGYGEMMERLQNNMLLSGSRSGDGVSFKEAPDETEISFCSLMENPDPFTEVIIDKLKDEDEDSDARALYEMYCYKSDGKDMLTALPFADLAGKRIVNVPIYPTRQFTGSNGMAAGNTIEEALVQGLSELFEREAHTFILEGKAVPPEIPDEVLRPYSFYPVIERLRSDKRYKVTLYDLSLGRGWPVAALCVHDLVNGTFGLNVGSHPSFPVAVERTLTESAQGKSMESFATDNKIGFGSDYSCNANKVNIMATGNGLYPASLFCGKPDWEFKPWTRFKGPGNREYLQQMFQLLKEEGHPVLVRDVSFLGFPSCYILIPTFSNSRTVDGTCARLKRTIQNASKDWRHFPDYNDEEALRLLSLIRYYEYSNSNFVSFAFGCPSDVPQYSNNLLGAYLALRLGEFPTAVHFLDARIRMERRTLELQYLSCLRLYAKMRGDGLTGDQAHEVIRRLYSEEAAERACRDTEDLTRILERCYPHIDSSDCSKCPMREKGCQYPDENELYGKVRVAMSKGSVSQEKLLKELEELW